MPPKTATAASLPSNPEENLSGAVRSAVAAPDTAKLTHALYIVEDADHPVVTDVLQNGVFLSGGRQAKSNMNATQPCGCRIMCSCTVIQKANGGPYKYKQHDKSSRQREKLLMWCNRVNFWYQIFGNDTGSELRQAQADRMINRLVVPSPQTPGGDGR
eukprot:6204005-Pleurochrysis_carterae.AAC.4